MPKPRTKERIVGTHFVWLLGRRGEVFVADGRSNPTDVGRHSLGTKDRDEAIRAIAALDRHMAVKLGLAHPEPLPATQLNLLDLDRGHQLYCAHVERPLITGGAGKGTIKRYRAVFDKFLPYVRGLEISSWNEIKRQTLVDYAGWLDGEGYAYATEYLELTTIKQAVKWLVENGYLPQTCLIRLPMRKPVGTDTYCWTAAEVSTMIGFCREHQELMWLGDVLTALACTGLRISELSQLRRCDVDLPKNVITLTDESTRALHKVSRPIRQTKNRKSRTFPIHADFLAVLKRIPEAHDGLLFHGPRGGVIKPDTVRGVLIRDVLTPLEKRFPTVSGEIGFRDGRLHSFRHYFCSACANSGVPEQVLMRWLGHSSSKMVKHYYHLHDEVAQREMLKLCLVEVTGAKRSAG